MQTPSLMDCDIIDVPNARGWAIGLYAVDQAGQPTPKHPAFERGTRALAAEAKLDASGWLWVRDPSADCVDAVREMWRAAGSSGWADSPHAAGMIAHSGIDHHVHGRVLNPDQALAIKLLRQSPHREAVLSTTVYWLPSINEVQPKSKPVESTIGELLGVYSRAGSYLGFRSGLDVSLVMRCTMCAPEHDIVWWQPLKLDIFAVAERIRATLTGEL